MDAPIDMMLCTCKSCELLLMRPDKKFYEFNSSELKPNGWYEERVSGDREFAYYICPSCGDNSDEYTDASCLLGSIVIPIGLAPELIKLWYKKKDEDVTDEYEYGIPLNDVDLKVLLLEYLI